MRCLRSQDGSSLAIVLTATLLLSAIGLALASGLFTSTSRLEVAVHSDRAKYTARAGLESACLDVLAGNADWTTLNSGDHWADIELTPGRTYDVSYTDLGDANRVQVDVTGRSGDVERVVEFVVERAGAGSPIRIDLINDRSLTNLVQ